MFQLAASTAAAQGLLVLSSPILTRLYSPSDLGLYGTLAAVILVLNTVSSLRYELAIPLPESERTAEELLALCLGLVVGFSMLLAPVLWMARGTLARLPHGGGVGGLWWTIPLGVLVAGVVEAAGYMNVRRKQFGTISGARAAQGVVQTVFQLSLGLIAPGALSLIVGDLISRTSAAVALLGSIRLADYRQHYRRYAVHGTAVAYLRFPKFMMAANLLNILELQLPILLVPFLFGASGAGNYFLAYRVLILPMALVGGAVSQVFMSESSRMSGRGPELAVLSKKLAGALLLLYAPLYMAIAVAGRSIFSIVFGAQWEAAGIYAQLLAPMALIWAVVSPISSILLVKDRLRESLAFTVVGLTLRVTAIAVGYRFKSLYLCCALLALFGFCVSTSAAFRFLRAARVDLRDMFAPLRDCVLYSLPIVLGLEFSAPFLGRGSVVAVAVALLMATYPFVIRSVQRAGLAE